MVAKRMCGGYSTEKGVHWKGEFVLSPDSPIVTCMTYTHVQILGSKPEGGLSS